MERSSEKAVGNLFKEKYLTYLKKYKYGVGYKPTPYYFRLIENKG